MSARRFRVHGQVQGVGFRPFVWRLANEHSLSGWVRNDGCGVEISVSGEKSGMDAFFERLKRENPELSRIDRIESEELLHEPEFQGFTVLESGRGRLSTHIPPDVSICKECLDELFDPASRRHLHAFINCTHCGPRFTLTSRLPYDRKHTSMAKFPMCGNCAEEYGDPSDRRFHAQPNCCPQCGPSLSFLDDSGRALQGDPIRNAIFRILEGKILAVKGVGGFHLLCDAQNTDAISRLRASKCRDLKPFAVMFANCASIMQYAEISAGEKMLLESRERPVVLLRKSRELPEIAEDVAEIGAMLPGSPLHYLLFHEAAGRPSGTCWLDENQALVLVATSANIAGDPLVISNQTALTQLSGIAEGFLLHDRDILNRADDSVMRMNGNAPQFLRRGRGFVPIPIKLPMAGPSVLALGGFYKNTFCITRGDEAFVSQHIGDLDNASCRKALEEAVFRTIEFLEVSPDAVASDLHPDFYSTRLACEFASGRGVPHLRIQHHHAHVASVMAEHGITSPVIGLALDGTGLGNDGGLWGGELLVVSPQGHSRAGHFRELNLPGGDAASKEPWRLAVSALHALGRDDLVSERFGDSGVALLGMIDRGLNSPLSSSAGRLFDAAAGLLGVCSKTGFEGQAAMRLEKLAIDHGGIAALEYGFSMENGVLDFLPLLSALAEEKCASRGAALFHATLVQALCEWVLSKREESGIVIFSGGCFLNTILARALRKRLIDAGMQVFEASKIPPNDGGISLGQAYAVLLKGAASCV